MKQPGCDQCDGGHVWVSDRWARHQAAIGCDDAPSGVGAERWAAYRAWMNTTYPCPACRPIAYERWLSTVRGVA